MVSYFDERLEEVEAYLDFLATLEERARHGPPRLIGAEHPISTQQQRILYSTVYVQLYNLVEATISSCLEAVGAAAMNDGRWFPSDLSDSLRREWVRNTARTHEDLSSERRLDSALALCSHLVELLPLSGFSIEKGGGGNWDDVSIENIARRLGFRLSVSSPVYSAIKRPFRDDLGPLRVVKKLRNDLAHGSISFAQCAEDMTVERLLRLKDATVAYLLEVIASFDLFISTFGYIRPERRPK